MSELGPEGRALLDAARNADDDDIIASRERVRGALGRKLGAAAVGLGAVTAASTAAAGTTATVGLGLFAKVAIGLAALGVVAGGVAVTRTRASDTPATAASPVIASAPRELPVPIPEPATTSLAAEAPPVASAPAAIVVAAPPAKTTSTAASVGAPQPAPSVLADEIAALRIVNAKLANGDGAGALKLLEEAPASGTLSEERAGLRLLARCAMGTPGAAETASGFLAAHPSSPLAARLKSTCKID